MHPPLELNVRAPRDVVGFINLASAGHPQSPARRDKVRQYPISSPPCLAMLPFGLGLPTVCCLQAGCWGCRL